VKVKFVCDCCDSVFDEFDVDENSVEADDLSLTGEASQDIIIQNREDSEVCVSSTCRECRHELDEYEPEDGHIRYYRAPLLH
jgi:hypothetical protein